MSLNPASFVTANGIEDFAIRYANEADGFIAQKLFPPVIVSKTDFKVFQYSTANFKEVETQKISTAEADLVDFSVFSTTYQAALHKLAYEWDPAWTKDFDPSVADVEQKGAATVMDKLLIRAERIAATLATTAGNYPAALTSTLGAGATWAVAGGSPEADANTARLAVKTTCGREANAVAMSYKGYANLRSSPAIADRIKGVVPGKPQEDLIKDLLGVKSIYVGKAQYISAVEGNATQTLNDIWDDSAVFFYEPQGMGDEVRYGSMYLRNNIYSHRTQMETRGSGDGRIQRLEMGWWYKFAAGAVVSSSDGDFTAGYLLKNIF